MLTLSSVETELKSRARPIGAFTAQGSQDRMRYAILRGAQQLAAFRDWDYLHESETLTTSAGNLGPYTAPTGMMRFATLRQFSHWGFSAKDTLAPILATDTAVYRPYLRIDNDGIYFLEDPGSGDKTFNFISDVTDSIVEADLTATVAIIPNGLKPALMGFALADLWNDLPRGAEYGERMEKKARDAADEYWHQSTLAQAMTQRGIHPKGVNGVGIDNHAQVITIIGTNFQGSESSDS